MISQALISKIHSTLLANQKEIEFMYNGIIYESVNWDIPYFICTLPTMESKLWQRACQQPLSNLVNGLFYACLVDPRGQIKIFLGKLLL